MNKALEWKTNDERVKELADKFVKARKSLKITQKDLAIKSGVSYGSIRRFEKTGLISLISLVALLDAIGYLDDFYKLLTNIKYSTFEEMLKNG